MFGMCRLPSGRAADRHWKVDKAVSGDEDLQVRAQEVGSFRKACEPAAYEDPDEQRKLMEAAAAKAHASFTI